MSKAKLSCFVIYRKSNVIIDDSDRNVHGLNNVQNNQRVDFTLLKG